MNLQHMRDSIAGGYGLCDDEKLWLIAEVERLMETNRLYRSQNEENAQAYAEGCEVNRRQWEALQRLEAERDRYKAALKWIAEEANTGESGDAGVMREEALQTLAGVVS